jgi:hypothetical protein
MIKASDLHIRLFVLDSAPEFFVLPGRFPVGSVVQDIRVLAVGFVSTTFHHVNCSLNEVVHILARSCDLASLGFISDFAPDCISKTLYTNVV